ncbi:MAG TPA: YlzJ-like family protein, partial [Acetivibrio sp.]|nr:YlzJ-like family protein [Acetivibrio sp.]
EWADQNNLELNYLGEKVVVVPLSNNRYRIERVISTSPKAYLNPKLMPGSIILGNELSFR